MKKNSTGIQINEKKMRWIYISPHFDDAVLSCGGLIWEQTQKGIPVEIWTVHAGDPPAGAVSDLITRVHTSWNTGTPIETVIQRRIEDQNAAKLLGANFLHLPMVDAIYRCTKNGTCMYINDVFDPIHPQDTDTVAETAHQIGSRIRPFDRLLIPLALGGHVDHIITRNAVESLGSPVWYYADIPYLFKHTDELSLSTQDMKANTFSISNQGLETWQNGIEAYASQLPSLFGNLQNMLSQIYDYRESRNGQTLWKKTKRTRVFRT